MSKKLLLYSKVHFIQHTFAHNFSLNVAAREVFRGRTNPCGASECETLAVTLESRLRMLKAQSYCPGALLAGGPEISFVESGLDARPFSAGRPVRRRNSARLSLNFSTWPGLRTDLISRIVS
jgi:hypothetical protein